VGFKSILVSEEGGELDEGGEGQRKVLRPPDRTTAEREKVEDPRVGGPIEMRVLPESDYWGGGVELLSQ